MKERNFKRLQFVVGVALIAVIVNLPALFLLNKNQVKVGVVDVQSLLMEHEKKLTSQIYGQVGIAGGVEGAAASIVESQTKDFVEKLEKAIDQINADCGCVLVNKAALLTHSGNVTDYTSQVKEALK